MKNLNKKENFSYLSCIIGGTGAMKAAARNERRIRGSGAIC